MTIVFVEKYAMQLAAHANVDSSRAAPSSARCLIPVGIERIVPAGGARMAKFNASLRLPPASDLGMRSALRQLLPETLR